jgi:hypothetical protein
MENTNEEVNTTDTVAAIDQQHDADLSGVAPKQLFSVHIEWAEGHGPENESDAADGAKIAKEFFDSKPSAEDMPDSIDAITIKRI